MKLRNITVALLALFASAGVGFGQTIDVEGQPLAANARRLLQALDFLGRPLDAEQAKAILKAADAQDAIALQKLLDPHALLIVHLNPESRVKVKRGQAAANLQQAGFTPFIIKVHNESTVTRPLKIGSPQALPIYSRGKPGDIKESEIRNRFLDVEMFTAQPMTKKLSGLQVEYAIALIHSSQAGKREATISFDVGQGTQDLGFRAEAPVLFNVKPAIPVQAESLRFRRQTHYRPLHLHR